MTERLYALEDVLKLAAHEVPDDIIWDEELDRPVRSSERRKSGGSPERAQQRGEGPRNGGDHENGLRAD